MRSVVCIKEVRDPDAPVRVDGDGGINLEGVPWVPNPYDENALEAAVQLKEQQGGEVVALSVGFEEAERTVLRAMAIGADSGILVALNNREKLDSYATVSIIAAVTKRIGLPDLIICGREADDTSAGVVGPVLAEQLGIPCITLVSKIHYKKEGLLEITNASEDGDDILEVHPPLLVTICGGSYQPRYPSMLQIMAARRRGVQKWPLSELGLPREALAGASSLIQSQRKWVPSPPGGCVLIEGETDAKKAKELAHILQAAVKGAS